MAEELIINVSVGGDAVPKLTKDVKDLTTAVGGASTAEQELGKNTKETEVKQESLRSQLRKGREELYQLTKGTTEYSNKLKEVAALQARQTAVSRELKASNATLGQTMTNVNSVVGGLAGGMSIATGTMSLFGIESDGALKALVKMQALMSITSGLSSLNKGMRAFDGLKNVFGDVFSSTKQMSDGIINATTVTEANTVVNFIIINIFNIHLNYLFIIMYIFL